MAAANVEMGPPIAGPPLSAIAEPTLEDNVRFFGNRAMRAIAGDLAVRHLCSSPYVRYDWWKIWRDGSTPWHEAGHVVISHVTGTYPWRASIIADKSVKIGTGYVGGFVCHSHTPEPPPPDTPLGDLETDRHIAADSCRVLGIITPPFGWRGAVRAYHRLRAETQRLIAEHWPLIVKVAEALSEHCQLNHEQLTRILNDSP